MCLQFTVYVFKMYCVCILRIFCVGLGLCVFCFDWELHCFCSLIKSTLRYFLFVQSVLGTKTTYSTYAFKKIFAAFLKKLIFLCWKCRFLCARFPLRAIRAWTKTWVSWRLLSWVTYVFFGYVVMHFDVDVNFDVDVIFTLKLMFYDKMHIV